MSTTLHIGHHFFGAGNLGDDLMLAGFLREIARTGAAVRMTCCVPFDAAPMRLRFPQIDWLPYDDHHRAEAIRRCDAWLGLGDTPFQTVLGDWMLDHLLQEAAWCKQLGRPMFYLCVGGDAAGLATHPKARRLASQAERIWTRDATSATWLHECAPAASIDLAADLAHVWLRDSAPREPQSAEVGVVFNFEQREQASTAQLRSLIAVLARRSPVRWLAQEVRRLPGSETALYEELSSEGPPEARLVVPDYAHAATLDQLLCAWGSPQQLLTTRYHAALIGAWCGWRTVVYPRSSKVRSAADELGLATISDFTEPAAIAAAVDAAGPSSRPTLLARAQSAAQACCEFFDAVGLRPEPDPPR